MPFDRPSPARSPGALDGRLAVTVRHKGDRMRVRFVIVAIVIALAAAACSSSSKGASSGGLDATTTVPGAANAACANAPLTSPDVGITDKTITVTVIADVQNGFRPGLFKGSWD